MKMKFLSVILMLWVFSTIYAQNEDYLFSPKGVAEVHITLSNGKALSDIKNEKNDADYIGKLNATIRITNSATSSYLAGELYEGHILIEGRGNTTWGVPKRPYNIDLVTSDGSETESALLGMPSADAWCILAFWHDRSLMRIPLAMYLGQHMKGIEWTPRLQYVELWINNAYRGLYCLCEKIERNDNRIPIKKLTNAAEDQLEPRISGGYILEASTPGKLKEREQAVQFQSSSDINFTFKYPKVKNVTEKQRKWIIDYINEFESVVYDDNRYKDPLNGYRKYININSFIDWTILHELSKGVDNQFWASVFVHKDRNDKLNMSAPWDFDLSFGNSKFFSEDGVWVRDHRWFGCLYKDENYAKQYNDRYDELTPLINKIPEIIQANYLQLEESGVISREMKAWPSILTGYRSDEGLGIAKQYKTHVQYLSEWIMSRHNWCYVSLGLDDKEKGDRMKTIKPIMRIIQPERMQNGEDFHVAVMKSDLENNKYTYSWNDEKFSNNYYILISQKGKYWVKIKDEWGNISLVSDTLYFGVDPPTSLIPIKDASLIFTCNNPVKDVLFINYLSSKASNVSFQLFDIVGNMVIKETIPVSLGINNFQISVSNLASGIYLMHFYTNEGLVSKKVIIL